MNPESWLVVVELFNDLCELPAPEREQHLELLGPQPVEVLTEVRSLLKAHDGVGDRFSVSAAALLGTDKRDTTNFALTRGTVLGAYEIVRRVGQGGMGAVYEAQHPTIGSRVAVKFLHRQYAADPNMVDRFFNEARAVNIIAHDNIVRVSDRSAAFAAV